MSISACRAETTTARWWGDDDAGAEGRARVLGPTAREKFAVVFESFRFDGPSLVTGPVGTLEANPYGVHDMLGNVWEWCRDIYAPYLDSAATDPDRIDPQDTTSARCLRGGSWRSEPRNVRAAIRDGIGPLNNGGNLGFRVVGVGRAPE